MPELSVGERVRVDIPDEADPDHVTVHVRRGTVVDVLREGRRAPDGAYETVPVYRVSLDGGATLAFSQQNLLAGID